MDDQSGSRSEPQLRVGEEEVVVLTHLGRTVLRWGWNTEFHQVERLDALRCGMLLILSLQAKHLKDMKQSKGKANYD